MWFAINGHSCPPVCDNTDVGGVYVLVGLDEVCTEYRCEELWGGDWVLLGYYVGCLLHSICRNNNAVVCFGVAVEESIKPSDLCSIGVELTKTQSRPRASRIPSSPQRFESW